MRTMETIYECEEHDVHHATSMRNHINQLEDMRIGQRMRTCIDCGKFICFGQPPKNEDACATSSPCYVVGIGVNIVALTLQVALLVHLLVKEL